LAPIKQDQTITFNLPNFNYYPYPSGTNTFSLGANATSGLPVSFSASGACTVSGTTVTVTGVGACVITASQAGNSNYNPATPVSRTFQSGPSPTGFDLLSLGPVNMTSTQTQGPIAALGDSIFQGTNLAYGFNGPNAVAVQGNVSFGNWGNTVNGNVVYSGSISRRFVTFRRGGFVQNPNALLPAVKDYALKVSAAWAALSANGMVDYKPWNQLILTGTNPTQNVFTVDGAKLAVANSLLINAPSGSTVILNISGANDRLQYMGISLNGPRAGRVVYNFYQATSLTIQGVGVNGTIWAPAAAVKFTSASITGSVIAGSMTDSSSQYQTEPFHGALPAVQ
jgi:choice-of-anchor A domain-containing protein